MGLHTKGKQKFIALQLDAMDRAMGKDTAIHFYGEKTKKSNKDRIKMMKEEW